jgi:hypothetical protein
MGKVYVTVDGKKKAFDTLEEANKFVGGIPTEFKKQAVVETPKEEELSSNVETKSIEDHMAEDPELTAEIETVSHVELSEEVKAEIKAEVAAELADHKE